MTRPRFAVIALAAFVGGAIGLIAATPAAATTIPIRMDFGVVAPGETAVRTQEIVLSRDSRVSSAEWTVLSDPTGTTWDVGVCSDVGCIAAPALVGTVLDAGTYEVVVSVTMADDVAQGAVAVREARLELVGVDGELAATGGGAPWLLASIGALAAGLGALLLIARRRSSDRVAEEAAR